MKHKIVTLFFLLLILIIQSCSNNKSNFVTNGKVIIAGNVLNFEKHLEFKNFNLYHHNLFEFQKIESVEINDDGSFHISIPCHYNMDFFIGVGRTPSYLICAPNDSLYLTIDADLLNDPNNQYPNDSYFLKVIGGTRIKDNQFVNEFILKSRGKKLGRIEYFKIIETSSPFEYLSYQNKRYEMEMTVLDSISKKTNTNIFKDWAKDFSKYEKIGKLIKYPKLNAKENNINFDSLYIPTEYFNKVFEPGINDNHVFSFYHNAFFDTYYWYLFKQAKKEEIDVLHYICNNAKGFSKDMAISKYFISSNKKSDTLIKIDYDLIENEYVRDLLELKIENENKKKTELLNLKAKSTITDSLFSKYIGNVVYVDFWATWCSPCMKEIPWSMELHDDFKDKPVVFLFLCNQSKYEDWQKIIIEKEINGEHVFLTDDQFSELKKLFNIKGVPHYLLINKKGGIINNAPRPSNKRIDQEIQKLLNE